MGAVESSERQENEIINWTVQKSWDPLKFGKLSELKILGDFPQKDKTKNEKNLTQDDIFENIEIGTWKTGGRGSLHFKDIIYDANDNIIISLKKIQTTGDIDNADSDSEEDSPEKIKGEITYILNWKRRNKWDMFSSPKELLKLASYEATGESRSVATEACRRYNCDKNYNRRNDGGINITFGGSPDLYKYIVNPNTGRKVKITGKLGK